jgi:hypothetical protein
MTVVPMSRIRVPRCLPRVVCGRARSWATPLTCRRNGLPPGCREAIVTPHAGMLRRVPHPTRVASRTLLPMQWRVKCRRRVVLAQGRAGRRRRPPDGCPPGDGEPRPRGRSPSLGDRSGSGRAGRRARGLGGAPARCSPSTSRGAGAGPGGASATIGSAPPRATSRSLHRAAARACLTDR